MDGIINDYYDSFHQTALTLCEGDIKQADYFMDTSVMMYYYRIRQKNKWIIAQNERAKNK